jgi:hypothetical protein
LLTLHYPGIGGVDLVYKYFDEFGAKIEQALIFVLGAIAELIYTKNRKICITDVSLLHFTYTYFKDQPGHSVMYCGKRYSCCCCYTVQLLMFHDPYAAAAVAAAAAAVDADPVVAAVDAAAVACSSLYCCCSAFWRAGQRPARSACFCDRK